MSGPIPNSSERSSSDNKCGSGATVSAYSSKSKQDSAADLIVFDRPEPSRMNFEGGASSLSSSDARTLLISSVTVAESWLRFLLAGFISEISVLLGDMSRLSHEPVSESSLRFEP